MSNRTTKPTRGRKVARAAGSSFVAASIALSGVAVGVPAAHADDSVQQVEETAKDLKIKDAEAKKLQEEKEKKEAEEKAKAEAEAEKAAKEQAEKEAAEKAAAEKEAAEKAAAEKEAAEKAAAEKEAAEKAAAEKEAAEKAAAEKEAAEKAAAEKEAAEKAAAEKAAAEKAASNQVPSVQSVAPTMPSPSLDASKSLGIGGAAPRSVDSVTISTSVTETSVTVTATVGTSGITIVDYVDFVVSKGGTTIASGRDNSSSGGWTHTFADLNPGEYTVTVKATSWSLVGSPTTAQSSKSFTIKAAAPAVGLEVVGGNDFYPDENVTVKAVVDWKGDPSGTRSVTLNGTAMTQEGDGTFTLTIPASELGTGDHDLTVTATNSQGTTGTGTLQVTVNAFTAPSVDIDAQSQGETVTEGDPATISGTWGRRHPGTGVLKVQVGGKEFTPNISGGTWSVEVLTGEFGPGELSVLATVTNERQAPATAEARTTVTVTAVAPSVSVEPAEMVETDDAVTLGGAATANGHADLTKVEVVVTGEGGTDVRGSSEVSGTSADWAVELTDLDLPPGQYTVTATAFAGDDNPSEAQASTLTVTAVAPSVSVEPAEMVETDDAVTLGGAATANGHADLTKVEVVVTGEGGTDVRGSSEVSGTSADWAVELTDLDLPPGQYTVTATAFAGDDNPSEAQASTLTVTAVAPSVSVEPAEMVETDDAVTLGGAATANGHADLTRVEVSVDGIDGSQTFEFGEDVKSGDWDVSFGDLDLAPGEYTVTATAFAGDTASEATTGKLTVTAVKPVVMVATPDSFVEGGSLTATGTAVMPEGAVSTVESVLVTVLDADSEPKDVPATVDGDSWTADFGKLAPGTYTVKAVATSTADESGENTSGEFSVSPVAPSVTITKHVDVDEGQTAVIEGTATKNGVSEVKQVVVTLFDENDAEVDSRTLTDGLDSWSAEFEGLAPGKYTVKAVATTDADKRGWAVSKMLTVISAKPSVSIESGAVDTDENSGVVVGGTATKNGASALTDVVVSLSGGHSARDMSFAADELSGDIGSWSADFGTLAPGDYTVSVRSFVGDVASDIATRSFTVTAVAPTVTVATPSKAVAGESVTFKALRLLTARRHCRMSS